MKFFSNAKSAKAATNNHFPSFPSSQNQTSNIKNPKSFPSRPWREQCAFSLTEVVIAMGVAAVAFTSIIALFPIGLNMSKESYEASQAALIAQTILADLRDQVSTKNSSKIIQKTGSKAMVAANFEIIQMNGKGSLPNQDIYLAYDQKIRTDSSNSPIMLRPCASQVTTEPTWFTKGTNGPLLLVKVSFKRTNQTGTGESNPDQVDVTVESPANAPSTNRVQYIFTGVIPAA